MTPGVLDGLLLGGGLLASLAGLLLGLWACFADRAKGRRRCPRCWYDMAGTPGLRCPECGRLARRESALARTRRRWSSLAIALLVLAIGNALLWRYFNQSTAWRRYVPTPLLIFMLDAERPWTFEVLAARLRGPEISPYVLSTADRLWDWQRVVITRRLEAVATLSNAPPASPTLRRLLQISELRRAETSPLAPPPPWVEKRWTPSPAEWVRTVEGRGSVGAEALLAPLHLKPLPADDWMELPKILAVAHDLDADGVPDAVLRLRRAGLDDFLVLLRRGDRWTLAAALQRPRDVEHGSSPFLTIGNRLFLRRSADAPRVGDRPADLLLLDPSSPAFPVVATLPWIPSSELPNHWELTPTPGPTPTFSLRLQVDVAAPPESPHAWQVSYAWNPATRRFFIADWHWTSPTSPQGRWRCPPMALGDDALAASASVPAVIRGSPFRALPPPRP